MVGPGRGDVLRIFWDALAALVGGALGLYNSFIVSRGFYTGVDCGRDGALTAIWVVCFVSCSLTVVFSGWLFNM